MKFKDMPYQRVDFEQVEKDMRALMEAFENDITRSTLVTRKKYEQRDLTVRIKEQFCRLLSPVL